MLHDKTSHISGIIDLHENKSTLGGFYFLTEAVLMVRPKICSLFIVDGLSSSVVRSARSLGERPRRPK